MILGVFDTDKYDRKLLQKCNINKAHIVIYKYSKILKQSIPVYYQPEDNVLGLLDSVINYDPSRYLEKKAP